MVASEKQATLAPANLDILVNFLESIFIDDRSHICFGSGYIAKTELSGPLDHLLQDLIVDLIDNDRPRAGGAFLSLKAKSRGHDPVGSGVQVGGLINHHSVFAAHLKDRAL